MEPSHVLLLAAAGLVGGYVAGLSGVGGGIIFVPVLLFHLRSIGVDDAVLPQLTIGSSLLCTLLASLSSARHQIRRGAVVRAVAIQAGLASAVSVWLVTRFVTTQSWFDTAVFQLVFAAILVVAALRMLVAQSDGDADSEAPVRTRPATAAGTGLLAGAVSASAGVGGGIVLVPLYRQYLRLPIHAAVGTSSASIVIVTLAGVSSYVLAGLHASGTTDTSVGYVDAARALVLALPAMLTASRGVATAHRLPATTLRRGFAVLMLLVAARLVAASV